MNPGKLVFAQIMEHLPLSTFRRCVARYDGERKVKRFSCLDQYLCMAFAQLTWRESLRDIEACLRAQSSVLSAGLAAFALGLAATAAQAAPAGGLVATVDKGADRSGLVEKVTWYGDHYYRPYRYRYYRPYYGYRYYRPFYGHRFYGHRHYGWYPRYGYRYW